MLFFLVPPAEANPYMEWAKVIVQPVIVLVGIWLAHLYSKQRDAKGRASLLFIQNCQHRIDQLSDLSSIAFQTSNTFMALRYAQTEHAELSNKKQYLEAGLAHREYLSQFRRWDDCLNSALKSGERYGRFPFGSQDMRVPDLGKLVVLWAGFMAKWTNDGSDEEAIAEVRKACAGMVTLSEKLRDHERRCQALAAENLKRAKELLQTHEELDEFTAEFVDALEDGLPEGLKSQLSKELP